MGLTPGKPGLMLARLQQQFTEGLALRSSSSNASCASGANVHSASSSTLDTAQSSSQAAAANGAAAQPATPAAAAAAGAGTQGGSSSSATPARRCWPRSLPDSLLVKRSVQLQADPITAVAAADAAADGSDSCHVFVVGHSGLLRVLDGVQLSTVRSMKLEHTELLCISLLPPGAAGSRAAGVPSSSGGRLSPEVLAAQHTSAPLPFMLAGAQSGRVLGYAATAGRLVGSWAAHADAVSCMLQLGGGGPGSSGGSSSSARLATASWDCSVKLWELSEGRQPWSTTTPIAAAELRDLDAGVWALAGSACGRLLVSGSEEGVVAAWDLRTRRQIWAAQVIERVCVSVAGL
jgi:hypothetical protein